MTDVRKAVFLVAGLNIVVGIMGYNASALSLRYGLSIIPGGLLSLVYITLSTSWPAILFKPVLPTISIITWLMVLLVCNPKEIPRKHIFMCLGTLVAWYGLGVVALYIFAIRVLGT